MIEEQAPTMSREGSITSNSGPVAKAESTLHDRTPLYLTILAFGFSTLSLGTSLILPAIYEARIQNLAERAQLAERESRVMEERWNDLKVELTKRGIPVSDH